MKIIYFHICSIPLFLMILIIAYSRKMHNGNANRLFLSLTLMSLISALSDMGMVLLSGSLPLSRAEYVLETALAYVYLAVHNGANAVLLLFLLSLTRMTSLFGKRWIKIAFCLPNAVILLLLALNPFTHAVFTVTAEAGYSRGALMPLVYAMAGVYGCCGLVYCVYSKRFLAANKWAALLCMYVLTYLGVLIQFLKPALLVEMFCCAVGAMGVMLSVMRPEERMDTLVGMQSWNSYREDIRSILLSGERVKIAVIRLMNARELLSYLGDHQYNAFISAIGEAARSLRWKHMRRIELYFERPGTVYLIADEEETDLDSIGQRLLKESGDCLKKFTEAGVRFETRVCLIRCPDDLQKAEDIISLGHIFCDIDKRGLNVTLADDIVHSRSFAIYAHMETILNRAVRDRHIEVFYQPIYSVRSGGFHTAEALVRIRDPEFGLISPGYFIPAAEALGMIVPIGDAVLENVFRFASEHSPDSLGLRYLEINLSVAQCMQSSLPEKLRELQGRYGVDPGRINLEITETTFENISEIMLENIDKLIRMGYSFTLDDYGIGYSSIQRVNHIPLKLIKIDKSILDEVSSASGRMILEHTVRMMQSIDKELVAEGAETREMVELLEHMDCDYIQGFYFSRPLPENEFIRFMEEKAL